MRRIDPCAFFLAVFLIVQTAWGVSLPELSILNGGVEIPTQEWPYDPGPRNVTVYVHYPRGSLGFVNPETGLMLSLHNWGGTHAIGTADPDLLANKYNLVVVCVDYLQSGDWKDSGKPYDFGMYQAIDALRALHWVYSKMVSNNLSFDRGRLYACGGSGGGNVSLMAAKFAPRTFACVVDMSGMAKLNEDIAYGQEGGSELDAGYSCEPGDLFYLSRGSQDLRFMGNPKHLRFLKDLGCTTRFIISHGVSDSICPATDAREMVENLKAAGLPTDAHFIEKEDLDGKTFTDTGHSVGDRTLILQHFCDPYLLPHSEHSLRRESLNDFDLKDDKVIFEVTGGEFVVDYREGGAPSLRFVDNSP